MPQLPVILTAFAQSPGGTFLAALDEEQKQIQAALQPATDSGAVQFVELAGSRNKDITQLIAKYPNQVNIFHFGGHADSESLLAEDGSIFVEGLADQLAIQSQIQLVFLNGCQTQAQVQHFFRQGIPIVLATTCSIADGEASYFAAQFYSAIAGRHSIRKAFQLAVGALKAKYDQYRGVELPAYRTVRGVRLREQQWSQVPWQLYVQEGREEVLEWQLRYPHGLTRLPSLHLETDCLGRETELETLKTLLNESSKVVLVSGLGGMGKTTLAAGYLEWLRNDYDYIAWINSSDDLMSSFALNEDLAKNLELPFIENEKIEDRFARLMNKLRNQQGRNLLVIDDVGDQVSEIAGQLPSGANWQVLVTSRLPLPDFREMKLGVLQASDALRLFRLYFQEGSDEEVQALLVEINYHTLTIEVMAKTLQRLNGLLTIPELLVILHERKLDDPRLQELVWTRHAGEERAIFFHLMKAFELAKLSEEEIWLMQQYAVLPAIPIEVKTLADLLQQESLDLNRQVNGLNDKGWIGKLGKGMGMHRMVQEVVKYQKSPNEDNLISLVFSLNEKIKGNAFTNPSTDIFPWIPHAESLGLYMFTIALSLANTAIFLHNLAIALQALGKYNQSVQNLKLSLQIDLINFGDQSVETAHHKSALASVYKDLGLYKEAIIFIQESLQTNYKFLDINDHFIALDQSILASIYYDLGQFKFSTELLEIVLEKLEKHFAPGHPFLSSARSNLAVALNNLGEYEKSKLLLESALAQDLKIFNQAHQNIAVIQSNLAVTYRHLGDLEKAASLLEQALDSDLKNLGITHPLVSVSQSNLALVYLDLGNYSKAKELLETILENDLKNFGEKHPNVAQSRANLGIFYYEMGFSTQAIRLLEESLKIDIEIFGAHHPNIAMTKMNLASIYTDEGQYDKALSLIKDAIENNTTNNGFEHPDTVASQSMLGLVYKEIGQSAKSIEILKWVDEMNHKNFAPEHPDIAIGQLNLALAYQDFGEFDMALKLLASSLEIDTKNFGASHPNIGNTQGAIAMVFSDLGRYNEAESLLKKAIRNLSKHFSQDHPDLITMYSNLAIIYHNLGKNKQAVKLLKKVIKIEMDILSPHHPNIALRKSNLAVIYTSQENDEEALKLLMEAFSIIKQFFQPGHPSFDKIAQSLDKLKNKMRSTI